MQVKKGEFVIVDVDTVEPGKQKPLDPKDPVNPQPGGFQELETAPEDVKTPKLDPKAKTGPGYERNASQGSKTSTKNYAAKQSMGSGGSKAKVSAMWENATRAAMSSAGSSLSAKGKRLLMDLKTTKPKIDWKKELKKFMDSALNKWEETLPNRRFLGSGDILYGRKRAGKDTLRTLVLPVDTSGSISKEQIKTFISEVLYLSTKMDIDTTYIIYCSDDIDSIDIVKKGGKPDFGKIASTGGNAKGFIPPFAWIQEQKINPSVVIYLTDSFAEYPNKSSYGISKYVNRVFWFICEKGRNFNVPPFGKYIHVPMDSKGNFV
jgi:predicted metal-dependent peptidase